MKAYHLTINGHDYVLQLNALSGDRAEIEVDGQTYAVDIRSIQDKGAARKRPAPAVKRPAPAAAPASGGAPAMAAPAGANSVTSPIPGAVIEVFVKEGDDVESGQNLVKLEAMKMENQITAPKAGKVAKVHVKAGDPVNQGQVLIELS
jgi:biotin carboxyl carrier protein